MRIVIDFDGEAIKREARHDPDHGELATVSSPVGVLKDSIQPRDCINSDEGVDISKTTRG